MEHLLWAAAPARGVVGKDRFIIVYIGLCSGRGGVLELGALGKVGGEGFGDQLATAAGRLIAERDGCQACHVPLSGILSAVR